MHTRVKAHLALTRDAFATDILARPVYAMPARVLGNEDWELAWRQMLLELPPAAIVYAKVPVAHAAQSMRLARASWQLTDTHVHLEKNFSLPYDFGRRATFRLALPIDEEAVAAIARTSFSNSRWHNDAFISREAADALKEEWARNFWRGLRGDYMIVAELRGSVVGFHQVVKKGKVLLIDLIAVHEKARGQDIATGLLAYAEQRCGSISRMVVGTQLANRASLNLYERRGFRIQVAHHIWHYHLPRNINAGMVGAHEDSGI